MKLQYFKKYVLKGRMFNVKLCKTFKLEQFCFKYEALKIQYLIRK